ncbi:unnamed protein product, partial [Polarella glacialis]
ACFQTTIAAGMRGHRGPHTQLCAQKPFRSDASDGGFDAVFTEISSQIIDFMPVSGNDKAAYEAYRLGMAAQTGGDLKGALLHYTEALRLEEDPIDQSYIMYNIGIVFAGNGEFSKAAKYYLLAIDSNPSLCSAYNNLACIYHRQGSKAERDYDSERSDTLYSMAAEYWNKAIKMNPMEYNDAQAWLRDTGRSDGSWEGGAWMNG